MNSIQSSIDGLDLFDKLRGCWRFYFPGYEYAAGLSGFIHGFCLTKDLDVGSFNSTISISMNNFLQLNKTVFWPEAIHQYVTSHRSEIPLLYAASDFGRNVIYENAMIWNSSKKWRINFSENEQQFNRHYLPSALDAPVTVVIVEGNYGYWHIFYLNDKGQRFFEASMSSQEKLTAWAESVLHINHNEWRKAPSGAFNAPFEYIASRSTGSVL